MIVDADDLVHRGLAGFVAQHPRAPGWVLTDGYIYSRSRQTFRRQRAFHHACGTSHVVRYDAYAVPHHLDVRASQSQVADAYGERMYRILGSHHDAASWLSANGWTLDQLPFRGAVYQVDTGENHSGHTLRGLSMPATRRFEETFGPPPRNEHAQAIWQALGPRAATEPVADLWRKVVRRLRRTTSTRPPGP